MQVGGDKTNGIMASTLPEVRHMASDGFVDITYGVPVTASKVQPLLKICADYPATRISIFIDSEEQLQEVEAAIAAAAQQTGAGGAKAASVQTHHGGLFGCFLKIDVGYHRSSTRSVLVLLTAWAPSDAGTRLLFFQFLLGRGWTCSSIQTQAWRSRRSSTNRSC